MKKGDQITTRSKNKEKEEIGSKGEGVGAGSTGNVLASADESAETDTGRGQAHYSLTMLTEKVDKLENTLKETINEISKVREELQAQKELNEKLQGNINIYPPGG